MSSITLASASRLGGSIRVPGDKSISHRSLIFASLAEGESSIDNLLLGEDALGTMRILAQMGVKMSHTPESIRPGDRLTVEGVGLKGLNPPQGVLDCGNSGTTMRLMLGLLAAQPFESILTGDESLNRRPMDRVMNPLKEMGARFEVKEQGNQRYIHVHGSPNLKGIHYTLPVASAQLKSALLLAGMYAEGETRVTEPHASRDHTERMLKSLGVPLKTNGRTLSITKAASFKPLHMVVPSDFSSAAFFLVAGLLVPDSDILIKGVGVNPTRNGLVSVLQKMGGDIVEENPREVSGEPVADLRVRSSSLKAVALGGDIIANIIDEIPILCIAAARAVGETIIRDAKELRVKESDRIAVMAEELKKLGVTVEELPDGLTLLGPSVFLGGDFESHGDHRVAMSLAVASKLANAPLVIHSTDCVATSFPGFFDLLESITEKPHDV